MQCLIAVVDVINSESRVKGMLHPTLQHCATNHGQRVITHTCNHGANVVGGAQLSAQSCLFRKET